MKKFIPQTVQDAQSVTLQCDVVMSFLGGDFNDDKAATMVAINLVNADFEQTIESTNLGEA